MLKPFGAVIQEARKRKGLTLEALAKQCGTHKGYVSGIENGKVSPPSPWVTHKFCKALDLGEEKMLLRGWAEKAPKSARAWAMDLVAKALYE